MHYYEKSTSTTKIVTKTVLLEIPVFKIWFWGAICRNLTAASWNPPHLHHETHLTAASLSSLLPFSVPRAQEFSLHRAQQHRPIVVYNPQQQVINYIRAQFKNQRLTGLSALLPPCKIPSAQHSQSVNKVVTDPCVFTEGSDRKVLGFLQKYKTNSLVRLFLLWSKAKPSTIQ